MADCSVPGCTKTARAKAMCEMHYRRVGRHGDPNKTNRSTPGPKRNRQDPTDWVNYDLLEAARGATGWLDQARCGGMPNRIFYPDGGARRDYEPAISVCQQCPVRYPCLAANLDEDFGCIGGTMPTDRRTIRKTLTIRRRAA